jgi:hypothetical protein
MLFHPAELLHAWETRNNRPREREACGPALFERWTVRLGQAPHETPPPVAPELSIVVTTFARPEAAQRVLAMLQLALERAGCRERAALLVLHDACGRDYEPARRAAARLCPEVLWLDARQRFGKRGFWQVHQTALLVARAWRPRLCLYLQDDVEFDGDLVLRALELWRATELDLRRRVLYLFSSRDDERRGRWVRFERRDAGPCRLTNWFDLQAFLVDQAFFELLDYRLVPVHLNRWTAGGAFPGCRAASGGSSRGGCSGAPTCIRPGRRWWCTARRRAR